MPVDLSSDPPGPSFLPRNGKEAALWLAFVMAGALVGRCLVVLAYRLANQE